MVEILTLAHIVVRSTDVWKSLPQSEVDAPSIQSFEVKMNKLWKNHPIQNEFTAPPLLWTVSPLDACAQFQKNAQDRAGTIGRNALPNTSQKRICKNL